MTACTDKTVDSSDLRKKELSLITAIIKYPEKFDSVIMHSEYQLTTRMADSINSLVYLYKLKGELITYEHKYYTGPCYFDYLDTVKSIRHRDICVGPMEGGCKLELRFEYKDGVGYLNSITIP